MLVPQSRMEEAINAAKAAAAKSVVGDPSAESTRMGPVVSEIQFNKIQTLIQKGIDEGADLIAGGPARPEGLEEGYFVRPTIFANVSNDMTIAREEIFGPVLSIIGYKDDDDAVSIANDTDYGLSATYQVNLSMHRQLLENSAQAMFISTVLGQIFQHHSVATNSLAMGESGESKDLKNS